MRESDGKETSSSRIVNMKASGISCSRSLSRCIKIRKIRKRFGVQARLSTLLVRQSITLRVSATKLTVMIFPSSVLPSLMELSETSFTDMQRTSNEVSSAISPRMLER